MLPDHVALAYYAICLDSYTGIVNNYKNIQARVGLNAKQNNNRPIGINT